MPKRRIRMRVGIALAYIFIMVPLMLGMVGYLYWSNSKIILSNNETLMEHTVSVVSADVNSLIAPVISIVKATSEIARNNTNDLKSIKGVNYFHQQMAPLPQVYSKYIGFEGDGHFYQSINIPRTLKTLGGADHLLHSDARHSARILDDSSGELNDSFIIYGDWGDVKQVYRVPPKYDPRKRPWYKAAWNNEGTTISDAYIFSSSGLVGLTVSHRVSTTSGVAIGTVGVDITLDTLSKFLKEAAIGRRGLVFLMDSKMNMVAHPNLSLMVEKENGVIKPVHANDIRDSRIRDAVQAWSREGSAIFEAQLGPEKRDYLVSFSPLERSSGVQWTVGVFVEKDELVGPLKKASQHITIAGLIVVFLAIFASVAFSRQLTEPIQRIVDETRRIQKFDLSAKALDDTSRITEVHQLTQAVETMKGSLSNFSIYVPQELVRVILSQGGVNTIKTQRQPLTVMFTDIKGFTNISEDTSAESLVNGLSDYFEVMSQVIHKKNGIIDKYIGDAIMAIWNAPVQYDNHVKLACAAMLQCRDVGDILMERFEKEGRPVFYTRFGLHTGEAVVGNVGASHRTQYSSFGKHVNLAARLEGLNKYYGTQLLVSEAVVEEASENFLFCHRDTVIPVGIANPIKIYELVAKRKMDGTPDCSVNRIKEIELWEKSFGCYQAREWQKAHDLFADYHAAYPTIDGAVVMMERCIRNQENPPPEDWDGAELFTNK